MFKLVPPKGIFVGWFYYGRFVRIGLLANTFQCGQRWVFLLRVGKRRLGYRTRGDATPRLSTYYDGGWHWPWQNRTVSGVG